MKEIAKLKAKEEKRKMESEVDFSKMSTELANIEGLLNDIFHTLS